MPQVVEPEAIGQPDLFTSSADRPLDRPGPARLPHSSSTSVRPLPTRTASASRCAISLGIGIGVRLFSDFNGSSTHCTVGRDQPGREVDILDAQGGSLREP